MNFKPKACKECGNVFTPAAQCNLYCSAECLAKSMQKSRKVIMDRYRLKQCRQVGVGKGNAQGRGESHHSYKSGIKGFSKRKLDSMDSHGCEECHTDLTEIIKTSRYKWTVHHIDHDRSNNDLSNLRLLCKRCHQITHKCHENFYKV